MARDPGNRPSQARRVNLNRPFRFRDSLDAETRDTVDYFTFTLTNQNFNFRASLRGLQQNADLILTGPVRANSRKGGRSAESLNRVLTPGKYFLQVRLGRGGTKTRYNLNLSATAIPPGGENPGGGNPGGENPGGENPGGNPGGTPPLDPGEPNDSLGTATPLKVDVNNNNAPAALLSGETVTVDNRRLGDNFSGVFDLEDYYSFAVTEPGVEARIDLIGFTSNLDLRLYDPFLNPLQTASNPGTTQESIPLSGGGPLVLTQTGTYLVQVFSPDAAPTPTTYSLSVSIVPPDRVGNDLVTVPATSDPDPAVLDAIDPLIETEQIRSDFVGGASGDVDVYNFTIPDGQQRFVSIELFNNTPAADIDLELYDSADLSQPVIASTRSGTLAGNIAEELAGTLEAGKTYFIKVIPKAGTTASARYTLEFTATNTINEPAITRDIFFGPTSAEATTLTNINGVLYFAARDNSGASSLWRSTGALNNTVPIRSFNALPSEILALDGTNGPGTGDVFFLADGGLWTTTGAPGNATQITTVNFGAGTTDLTSLGAIADLIAIGDSLYLRNSVGGNQALYSLKKTGTSFTLAEVVAPAQTSIENFTRVGSTLYYSQIALATGRELYRIKDANNSITQELIDIVPGVGSGINSPSTLLAAGDNTLYFTANAIGGVTSSNELYRIRTSDTAPTLISTVEAESTPKNLTYVADADAFFFVADAEGEVGEPVEFELFKIADASTSTATTATLINVNTNDGVGAFNSINTPLLVGVGERLIFTASTANSNDAPVKQLFGIDARGTAANTPLALTSISGGIEVDELVFVGDKAAFTLKETNQSQAPSALWSSDGTLGGTAAVQGSGNVLNPGQLTAVGSRLFFVGEDVETDASAGTGRGSELWVIDP